MIDILAQNVNTLISLFPKALKSLSLRTEIFFQCERALILHQTLFGLVCGLLEK